MAFFRCGSSDLSDYSIFAVNGDSAIRYLGTGSVEATLPYNSTFNIPVTIGKNVSRCDNLFNNTPNFNSNITYLGNKITSLNNLLKSCYSYKRAFNDFPINSPNGSVNCCNLFHSLYDNSIIMSNSVSDCSNMLYTCTRFDSPVTFGEYVNSINYMFAGCYNFNLPITLPSRIGLLNRTFYYANKFNSLITFAPRNTDMQMYETFVEDYSYNQPLIIDLNGHNIFIKNLFISSNEWNSNRLTFLSNFNQNIQIFNVSYGNFDGVFQHCRHFNSNFNITFKNADSQIDIVNLYRNCSNFNKELNYDTWPIHNAINTLASCSNFNSIVTLNTNKLFSIDHFFDGCRSLNANIYFTGQSSPSGLSFAYLFGNCRNFNQSVSFNTINTSCTLLCAFIGCTKLNKPIIFPQEYETFSPRGIVDGIFTNCSAFNQDVYFPSQYTSFIDAFQNCISFGKNIYINCSMNDVDCTGMLYGTNNSKKKNVFFRPGTLNKEQATNMVNGFDTISWATSTNRIYNAACNVYIYNNYNP